MDLTSLFQNLSLNNILEVREKIRSYDGAYRQGQDIIIITDTVRTVRGSFKYTFLDGNPPAFSHFSLYGLDIEEDDEGKTYFMIDGNTPYTLSLLEAKYIQKLCDPDFCPSLYYSEWRGDYFLLNVDGTEKHIYSYPFTLRSIQDDFVICYQPPNIDGWCEPLTQRQVIVLKRLFNLPITELCPYKIE